MAKRYKVITVRDPRSLTDYNRAPYAVIDTTDPDPTTRVMLREASKITAAVEAARLNRGG